MTDIQRYQEYEKGVSENDKGEFVYYEDHASIVAALQEQVQKLACENAAMKSAGNSVIYHYTESNKVGMAKAMGSCMPELDCAIRDTPATDAVIREIGAKAVEEYSKTVGAEKNGAIYAAKLRAGEVS